MKNEIEFIPTDRWQRKLSEEHATEIAKTTNRLKKNGIEVFGSNYDWSSSYSGICSKIYTNMGPVFVRSELKKNYKIVHTVTEGFTPYKNVGGVTDRVT